MASASDVFRQRVREVRKLRGMTQAQLAAAVAALGVKMEEPAVMRLEKGTRGVSVDDVLAFSAALGVSPLSMIVPLEDEATLDVTPALEVDAQQARAWVRGQRPLRDTDDDKLFYTQAPEHDWDNVVPGVAGRFADRKDFETTRAKWQHEIFVSLIRDIGGTYSQVAPDGTVRTVIGGSDEH